MPLGTYNGAPFTLDRRARVPAAFVFNRYCIPFLPSPPREIRRGSTRIPSFEQVIRAFHEGKFRGEMLSRLSTMLGFAPLFPPFFFST